MIIRDLTDAEIIGRHEKGWVVKERESAAKLMSKVEQ
jgi:hypothetical protein